MKSSKQSIESLFRLLKWAKREAAKSWKSWLQTVPHSEDSIHYLARNQSMKEIVKKVEREISSLEVTPTTQPAPKMMKTESTEDVQRRSLQNMVLALRWEKCKPTKPGEYFTRHASDGSCVNSVTVTKAGRGLSVYCAAYHDRVPMSEIDESELEWAERPNTQDDQTRAGDDQS